MVQSAARYLDRGVNSTRNDASTVPVSGLGPDSRLIAVRTQAATPGRGSPFARTERARPFSSMVKDTVVDPRALRPARWAAWA